MRTSSFSFRGSSKLRPRLPSELRGQRRDQARLVVLDRDTQRVQHSRFDRLGDHLRPGDVLVTNDSLVLQDEIVGQAAGKQLTIVLCGHHTDGWHALIEPDALAKKGMVVEVADGQLKAVLRERTMLGMWLIQFEPERRLVESLKRHAQRYGDMYEPLRDHPDTFQNVYARRPGSLETPTAGLHFTPELIAQLAEQGVEFVAITLHVGLSELEQYWKIEEEHVEDHSVGAEWYQVTRSSADKINRARRQGRRIVAVGTTVVRTLETIAQQTGSDGELTAGSGWTDLYIHPGHEFRTTDAILTNLHRPRSSHLVMTAAFAGRDFTLRSYRELVRHEYEFDVFGDSMLLV